MGTCAHIERKWVGAQPRKGSHQSGDVGDDVSPGGVEGAMASQRAKTTTRHHLPTPHSDRPGPKVSTLCSIGGSVALG